MSSSNTDPRSSGFAAAVDFVSEQPGGAQKLLDRHRRRSDGNCSCCVGRSTPWPCTAAVIAQLADRATATSGQPLPRTRASDGE